MTESTPETHPFAYLGLIERICDTLDPEVYTKPTPVQHLAIPALLGKGDFKILAPTGTGKTAAFALPTLQKLQLHPPHGRTGPRALVLVPTRELAEQVGEQFKLFRKYLKPRCLVIVGGVDLDKQIELLEKNPDVIVATPGRLLDLIEREAISLDDLKYWILDEADRMLDVGFSREIARVQAETPKNCQVALFSATFPDSVEQLCGTLLNDPGFLKVGEEHQIPLDIEHAYLEVDGTRKREILAFLLEYYNYPAVLVFVQTKTEADGLASHLQSKAFKTAALHGDKRTGERRDILNSFKDGDVRVLIATDVAARGIDLKALPAVFNYDMPFQPEDYVHRIGRTGRAGLKGLALSLVEPSQRGLKLAVERFLGENLKDLMSVDFSLSMILPKEESKKPKKVFYKKKKTK